MVNQKEIYKCEVCGNIVEVLHGGAGILVCCGQNMKLVAENTVDAATEHPNGVPSAEAKHVPVIEGRKVRVGSVSHPMEDAHYIEWIEATSESGEVCKKFLKAGDLPEAEFCFEVASAREYCNLHGLWISSKTS